MKNLEIHFETIYKLAKKQDEAGLKALLELGGSIDEFKQGFFPLTAAGWHAKEGSIGCAEWLLERGANISWIACGAAYGGNIKYVEKLRITKCVNVTWIAYGAAIGGYIHYAERLRTQHGADVLWIARGAAQGGYRNYAENLHNNYGIHIDRIAHAAAVGGHVKWVEYMRTQYGANINTIVNGAATGGHYRYVEQLIKKFSNIFGAIGGYVQGGYFKHANKLLAEMNSYTNLTNFVVDLAVGGHALNVELITWQSNLHKKDMEFAVFNSARAGHFNYTRWLQMYSGVDIITFINGIASGGHIQYLETLLLQHPKAFARIAKYLLPIDSKNKNYSNLDKWLCYLMVNIKNDDCRKKLFEKISSELEEYKLEFNLNKILIKSNSIIRFREIYNLDYDQAWVLSDANNFHRYATWFLQGKQLMNIIEKFPYELFLVISKFYVGLTIQETRELDNKFELFRQRIKQLAGSNSKSIGLLNAQFKHNSSNIKINSDEESANLNFSKT